ncbi:aldo/keto reductase [bacterium]|nr:aldo/keto reductase [bacterium]
MDADFLQTTLGKTGMNVCRIGFSGTYRPGKKTIHRAVDEGINFFFAFGLDGQTLSVMHDVIKTERDRFVIASGAYNLIIGHTNIRRSLEKRLRQLSTDHLDVFLFLGVTKPHHLTDEVLEEMRRLREEGKVRAIAISTHDRKFAGQLIDQGALDVIMMRYNAAHRGAETDIFPYLIKHNPGVVSFTATRWRTLLKRPRGYPRNGHIPTPGDCYRFALSNPHIHVCMMAPSNEKHLLANLAEIRRGPLADDDLAFMREFGDIVHHTKKWFM